MAAAIADRAAQKQFPALEHLAQGHHHPGGGFLFHQLGVVDLVGGAVEYHQQGRTSAAPETGDG